MLRVHQFDKVEMFSFTAPEKSAEEHEFLLAQQRAIMEALELPYRVLNMATADLGAPAAKKYDIEAWLPGEKCFRETHSTSNTTDWQARRLNIRVRYKDKRVAVAHLLNGTAIAVGRMLIALIENHQQPDGTVVIPKALQPYTPFTVIKPD
jgi:seryl-tRNA synthetase